MNIGLKEQWDQQTADQLLMEATEGDHHLRAFALELREAMQELVNAHREMLTEMAVTDDQMRAIIKGASRVSQGKPAAQGRFSKGLEKLKAGGGKVGKAAGKVMGVVDKFVDKIDKSKPVDNFEQKFSKIRAEYLSKNPKMKGYLDKFAELSDKHPKTQAFTIGALSAIASVAGTPLAGAAVGSMLRAGVAAAKGERVVKSAAKGIALGAIGSIAGEAASAIADALGEAGKTIIDIAYPVSEPMGASDIRSFRSMITINGQRWSFSGYMNPEMVDQLRTIQAGREGLESFSDEWYANRAKEIGYLDAVLNNDRVQQELSDQLKNWAEENKQNEIFRAAEQAANDAATEKASKVGEIVKVIGTPAAGGAAAAAAGQRATQREGVESSTSLIVEANKNAGLSEEDILKIWNTEGSPKDIVEIYKIMKTKIGLSDKEITDILAGAGLDVEEIGLVDDVQAAPPPGEAPQQQKAAQQQMAKNKDQVIKKKTQQAQTNPVDDVITLLKNAKDPRLIRQVGNMLKRARGAQ